MKVQWQVTTARKAVNRLAFLVMRAGMPLTITEIRDYVRESIDVIVQTGRVGDARGILETYFPAFDGLTTSGEILDMDICRFPELRSGGEHKF